MKKQMIKRGLIGLPAGVTIGFLITIIISACAGDGSYYPVTPELTAAMGNELNAVILQTFLCAVMGAGFGMASLIWEIDTWSLVRQSGVYFLIACLLVLPIAYVANWMEHSVAGFFSYVGIFAGIFAVTWLSQYLLWREKVKKMNARVRREDGHK